MQPTISIKGAWAYLKGAPVSYLEECLTVKDPKARYNRAYKEHRWDGKVKLFKGRQFPAGLTDHVIEHFNKDDEDVTVVGKEEKVPIDTSRFDKTYLGGVGPDRDKDLIEEQCEAILAMLDNRRGVIKSPTGSGKTELMAAVARYLWEERGWRSIIVTSKKGIAKQTALRLQEYYGDDITVGQCGDGEKTIGTVTSCTAQTLIGFLPRKRKKKVGNRKIEITIPGDPELRKMVESYEVLFLDEAHHASAATWYSIAMHSGALRRFGLSGTPLKNSAIADMKLMGATGPIIYEVSADVLIEIGFVSRPKIIAVMSENASGPELEVEWEIYTHPRTGQEYPRRREKPYKEAYPLAIVSNEHHNKSVVRAAEWLCFHGRKTMVMCRRREHFKVLAEMLGDSKHIPFFEAVWGSTGTEDRDTVKANFESYDGGAVMLATTIFDEGENIPAVGAIVLAEGVKVSTSALQRIGRGMRKKAGSNDLWVVDFIPTSHTRLGEHGLDRVKAYESEGYEVHLLEDWPKFGDNKLHEDLLPFLAWDELE